MDSGWIICGITVFKINENALEIRTGKFKSNVLNIMMILKLSLDAN
jgi:hypothetical protein